MNTPFPGTHSAQAMLRGVVPDRCPKCDSLDRNVYGKFCSTYSNIWHYGYHSSHLMDQTGLYCLWCRACECHVIGALYEPCPEAPLEALVTENDSQAEVPCDQVEEPHGP